MTYVAILTAQDGGLLTVTLNRPDKLNAATDQMLDELNDAFNNAERDNTVRAILLTGAGRGFCAGQDLGAAQERQAGAEGMSYGQHLRRTSFVLRGGR